MVKIIRSPIGYYSVVWLNSTKTMSGEHMLVHFNDKSMFTESEFIGMTEDEAEEYVRNKIKERKNDEESLSE